MVHPMGREQELDRLRRRFRDWQIWQGVGSAGWYARRRRTSPPRVIRQPTLEDLRAEMEQREQQQDRWDLGR